MTGKETELYYYLFMLQRGLSADVKFMDLVVFDIEVNISQTITVYYF